MKIIVNGKPEQVSDTVPLEEYLLQKSVRSDHIVIELNHAIIKKEAWHTVQLKENDSLEIVRLVGGG